MVQVHIITYQQTSLWVQGSGNVRSSLRSQDGRHWGNLCFKHYSHYVWGLVIAFLRYNWYTIYSTGFPGGLDGKESASNAGDLGSIPGLGRSPEEGSGNPLQDSCLENPHGQRSLEGCSPWGRKESDTTERLNHNKYMFKGYNLISFGISISQWNHHHNWTHEHVYHPQKFPLYPYLLPLPALPSPTLPLQSTDLLIFSIC